MPEDPQEVDSATLAFSDQVSLEASASGRSSRERERKDGIWELTSLLEVSKALSGTSGVKARVQNALQILERRHGALRSILILLREGTQELYIDASVGLTANGQQARYHVGEGITGRVVATGKPVVVPQINKEALFLNRAGPRRYTPGREITVICVPILINQKPAGSLNVDLRFDKERNYSRMVKFLGVVASMIAQAVRIDHLVDAERRRPHEENVHLREEFHAHHPPPTLQTAEASGTVMNVSFKEAVEAYEKDLIQDTLKTTRGNRSKAASLLKTTERVIHYKVRKLHIDCSRFRR